jgi:hypothetical protein
LGVLASLLGVRAVLAQDAPDPAAAPAAAQAPGPVAEVEVKVVQFGLGGLARLGDWAGIQLSVKDRSTRVRDLVVRVNLVDADGDTAQIQSVITATPGKDQPVWLYARLPFALKDQPGVTVQVAEVGEGVGADGFPRMLRQVGTMVHQSQCLPATTGLMGVVGRNSVRLDQYSVSMAANMDWQALGHELAATPPNLSIAQLPDRWMGLAAYPVLVWSGTGADFEPGQLSEAQASAIKEWVQRGGHLVVLPGGLGQSWLNASANPLAEIMPAVKAERVEGVDLNAYRPLLLKPAPPRVDDSLPASRPLPVQQTVQVFTALDGAKPAEAAPILAGPDGRTVVVRRQVGAGCVTLVGLDLAGSAMDRAGFEADIFWHRVLGRRGQLEDVSVLTQMSTGSGLPGGKLQNFNNRAARVYDRGIPGAIAKTGRAAAGLMLAFGVFLVYWIFAGPLGFALLKRRNLLQHAWLAFLASAGVFTAVAWGGANFFRPRSIEGQHLTILDHVSGQPTQRARMWLSLLLPSYGASRVSVPEDEGSRLRNAVTPWDAPVESLVGRTAFPDARPYGVDGRTPSSIRLPTRSTVKQLQVDWAGGPPWRMPIPVAPGEAGVYREGGELRSADRDQIKAQLQGVLVHNLPGALTDVTFVVVLGQDLRRATAGSLQSPGGALLSSAQAFKLADSFQWRPGEPLDMAQVTADGRGDLMETYLARLVPAVNATELDVTAAATGPDSRLSERLTALSFFTLFEPPNTQMEKMTGEPLARRTMTHGWDLGRWFTQPCVIMVGHLIDAPTPVPVSVDGESASALRDRIVGRTMVRWVYPLPPAAPKFPGEALAEPASPAP